MIIAIRMHKFDIRLGFHICLVLNLEMRGHVVLKNESFILRSELFLGCDFDLICVAL